MRGGCGGGFGPFGVLSGVMNNASVEMRSKPVHGLIAEDINLVLGVDLMGVFYCMKHEFLVMKERGGGAIGHFENLWRVAA